MKDAFRKTTLLSYASSLGNRSSSLNSLATPIKSKYDVSTGHLETISDRICAFSHHTKVNSESLGYPCSPRQEKKKSMEASDILALNPEILRCAVLDDAGRIVSYAESEQGKLAKLPTDFPVTTKALVIEGLSEALPKDQLGNIKFTVVVTDRYRLVTQTLAGHTVMMALPLNAVPDKICENNSKKFGATATVKR